MVKTVSRQSKRRRLTPIQRKVAHELGKGELSDADVARKYNVSAVSVSHWKHDERFQALMERATQKDISIITAERDAILQALVDVAKRADPKAHQDRKLCLEIEGTYQEKKEEGTKFQQLIIVRAENPIVRPEKGQVPGQEAEEG